MREIVSFILTGHEGAEETMAAMEPDGLADGVQCKVIAGTHAGKAGTVRDIKVSKTGHVTITVVEPDGDRFKTLARNVKILEA